MSPDHLTSDRVYRTMKSDILSGSLNGRVNLPALVLRYASSATPIRESLLRLVGERLVDLHPRGGFGVRGLSRHSIDDLYQSNLRLVTLGVAWAISLGRNSVSFEAEPAGRLPFPTDDLFLSLAGSTASDTYVHLMGSMNDRMHNVRLAECAAGIATQEEFDELCNALRTMVAKSTSRIVARYHKIRLQRVADIHHALSIIPIEI